MLPYILAVVVGLSSLYLLTTAFIAPDRHRQDDFLWSAVGLFYALVLWLCAGRITGAILLGQAAAAILFMAFAWQTLKLRQALFYPDKPVKLFTIVGWLGNRLGKVTPSQPPKTKAKPEKVAAKVKETVATVAETGAAIGETTTESVTEIAEKAEEIIDDGETFDDFDFDLATEEINPAENPPEIAPTEPVTTVEVETITVSETVIIEVTEEDCPPEETIGEDTPPETRSPKQENPPPSD